MELLTKENIALAISIFSILITLFSTFRKLYQEKINLSVAAYNSNNKLDGKNIAFDLAFVNNARLPVSISKIELIVTNDSTSMNGLAIGKREKFIVRKTNKKITDITMFEEIPFTLTAKGSLRGWFQFEFDKLVDSGNIHLHRSELLIYCHNKIKRVKIDIPKSQPII